MKLSTVLFIAFTTVLLLAVGSISYFEYRVAEDLIKETVQGDLDSKADLLEKQISLYFYQNIERLQLFTSRTALRREVKNYNENPLPETLAFIDNVLKDAIEPIEEFERLCVLNLEGIVISSTDYSFVGKDASSRDFFLKAKNEEVIFFVEEEGEIKIFFSGPMIWDDELIGVGITVVKKSFLQELVFDTPFLGETGEIMLGTDKDGGTLFFERKFQEETTLIGEEIDNLLLLALNKEKSPVGEFVDYRGKTVLASTRFVDLAELGLVVKIDEQEIIGPLREDLIKSMIIIFVILMVIIVLFSFFISKVVRTPLKRITRDVDSITKGNLDIQLSKSNLDEFQNIVDSLNRVLASLKLAVLRTGSLKSEFGIGEFIKSDEEIVKFLDSIVENAPGVVYRCKNDDAWTMLFINDQIETISGYPKEDFINNNKRTYSSIIHPDDRPSIEEIINKATKEDNHFSAEYRLVDSKGNTKWVLEQGRVIFGDDESIKWIDGAIIDITSKKKFEEKLIRSEERTNSLISSLDDLFFVLNKDFVFEEYHQPKKDKLFVKPEDFIGKSIDEINFPKDVAAKFKKAIRRVIKTNIGESVEYSLDLPDGKKWFDARISSFMNDKGKVAGVTCVVRDITKNKLIEEEKEKELAYQELIIELSSKFIKTKSKNFDKVLNQVLRELGVFFDVDRSYVFRFSEDLSLMSNTHEWCHKEATPHINDLQNIKTKTMPWWFKNIVSEKEIHVPFVDKLPKSAKKEKTIFKQQSIKSLICLPLKNKSGKLHGFIGFDAVRKTNFWTQHQISMLKIFAELLANVIERKELEKKIKGERYD